jgi:hypothetical protein
LYGKVAQHVSTSYGWGFNKIDNTTKEKLIDCKVDGSNGMDGAYM